MGQCVVAPDGALLDSTNNVCRGSAALYLLIEGIGLSVGTYC